ncbi:MAG: class I SAM-dependent methyltransferase [Verrucomicrobiota bacterium]|nr:class I SAM-dependent methyltransferase [Verrucomicrobiota bacterium]
MSEKITRIASARGRRSVKQAILRLLFPMTVRSVMRQIDQTKLAAIAERYRVPGEKRHWPKYVDVERWLRLNLRRAHDLGLTRTPRGRSLNILDLGSGGGFFLLVCKLRGHRGIGLDLARPPLYGELFNLFGLRRVISAIEAFKPLPESAAAHGPFDLVTAFSVCFNGQHTPELWGSREWDFLLDDLQQRFLLPGGRVYLDLNPEKDGSFFTPELRAYFLARGAEIDRSKVSLRL